MGQGGRNLSFVRRMCRGCMNTVTIEMFIPMCQSVNEVNCFDANQHFINFECGNGASGPFC